MSEKSIVQSVIADVGGAFAAGLGYIGDRLGLFKVVAHNGPASSDAIASSAGLDERYVREWLRAMVSAGYVEHRPTDDVYSMTEEQCLVLADEGSPIFAAGAFQFALPSLMQTERLIEAFRNGGGISYAELGEEIPEAIDRMHRPWFDHQMTSQWLPGAGNLQERLATGIRVLDVGCGLGRSTVALAHAYPASTIIGIDPHPESIDKARALASERNVQNAEFRDINLEQLSGDERFDLILAIDCIHDMSDPVGALRDVRKLLDKSGNLFWSEPTGSHEPMANRDPVGKMRSNLSPYHCLTVSLASGGAGLGTIIGEAGARQLAAEAGFRGFEKLDIQSTMQQFFLLSSSSGTETACHRLND